MNKESNAKLRRTIPLWGLVLAVILATIGTVLALNITLITGKMNIYGQNYSSTDFTITNVDTFPKGQNKVTVLLKVHNNGATSASCTATVQLLDSNGDIINIGGEEQVRNYIFTNVPAGSDSNEYTFTFTANGLVAQYSKTYIILTQS